jgi:ornithine carbamoyltransferase
VYQLTAADAHEIRSLASAAGRGGTLVLTDDPVQAAAGSDALYTDVWTSMGQEEEAADRKRHLSGYSIDSRLVESAADDAVVMHCLPAHRGEEIAAEVVDGPRSVVWRQARHRLNAMRGLFAWLVGVEPEGSSA